MTNRRSLTQAVRGLPPLRVTELKIPHAKRPRSKGIVWRELRASEKALAGARQSSGQILQFAFIQS
jgi:hypothetical protein